jgi:predicted O-methyltransferase YrrM
VLEEFTKSTYSPAKIIRHVLHSPQEILFLLRGETHIPSSSYLSVQNIFSDTEISNKKIEEYLYELKNDKNIKKSHKELAKIRGVNELRVPTRCLALYILVRYHEPAVVVETGSYFGHSSLYILSGISRNNHGVLHTFDAHPNEIGWYPDLPSDFEIGYMVPDAMTDNWLLHRGEIKDNLRPKLNEIGDINLFFHDSNHSESHKRFEFNLAKQHLVPGGIIASHDVGHGNESEGSPPTYAFIEMARLIGAEIHSSREFEPGDSGSRVFAFCYLPS